MRRKDFGVALRVATEAVRFRVPPLGENYGGHVFIFDNNEDREQAATFYRDPGQINPAFVRHTLIRRDRVLVEFNGQLSDEKAAQYQKVLDSL